MSTSDRHFIWYELMTTDAAAARAFYQKVFDWEARPAGVPGIDYTLLAAGGRDVGGLFPMATEGCGGEAPADMMPCWLGYIASPDVDEDARRIAAAGGRVLKEPTDIPGVGRFAVVADPHGAVFQVMAGTTGQEFEPGPEWSPGHVGWHELSAGDGNAAWRWYSDLFGWTEQEVMDMGPAGSYRIFSTGRGPCGGRLTKTPEMPGPMWLFYFCVRDVDDAIARATGGGGTLLMGPHEVPGGAWIATFLDPQGAMFAAVGGRGGSAK